MRHLQAFWTTGMDYDVCSSDPEGCGIDPSGEWTQVEPDTCYNHTGSHHLTAVAWHAFTLLEFFEHFPEHDDRFSYPIQASQE